MSIQARANAWDERLYNINRDVAHNFGDVMREVADRLELGRWPELDAILKKEGVTSEEVGRACEAFCLFVMSSADDRKESMVLCLTRSGWYDVKPAAQIALMSILGTVMAGYYWSGVREATMGGSGPCLGYADLKERGASCARLMATSRLSRLWGRARAWALRVLDAATGRGAPGWKFRESHPQGIAAQAANKPAAGEKK